MKPGPLSERALILAPHGRDAQVAAMILREAVLPAETCADLATLCAQMMQGAGLALITDQAILDADLRPMAAFLNSQPAWSDFPIILLTQRETGAERNPAAVRIAELLGNVTFVERPFHAATLISVVRTAVRSRRRQYEARARLDELHESEGRLSDLTATLEQRVRERSAELMIEVAARERAQEQLLQSQKMEAIGQLTGGVAHDFNNLLMAVMGNLELLKKRFREDARAQHLIAGALEGARRGAALTRRMLAFARQQELKTAAADLVSLVAGMQELLDRTLGPQIELRFDLPEGLPAAKVDTNQIELAILNLAINARDAMPDGGTICISVDQAVPPPGKPLRDPAYLRLRLSDTGCGMDSATLSRAIDPFFSTKPVGKGTGLGLSMAHGLAVQLGGMLTLESTVGQGTTATLWLPIATEPVLAAAPEPERVELAHRATILVVDDDPLIAMSTVEMLEDLGHKAIEANSAAEALKILKTGEAIDLMLTDQAMPGMTGTELAEIARKEYPTLPVLLATGYTDLPAGQIKLPRLSKPYLQSELQEEINRLLNVEMV
jgi:signal transduction histidine kinase/CheY-like chemotaxis protein